MDQPDHAQKNTGPSWLKLAISVALFGLVLAMLAESGREAVIPVLIPFAFLAGWFFLFRKPEGTKTHD
jgi:hydrogenase/urease accessory protein HupE|tara:strand:- start:3545 stop:3748 length:204 start_codon:yes stop_codon:yes gene_type:complete